MTLATLTIGDDTYSAYAGAADVTEYLQADFLRATVWSALSTRNTGVTDQARVIVTATRRIDAAFSFIGQRANPTQELKWPRSGVILSTGAAVSDTEIPNALVHATALLCGDILLNERAGTPELDNTNIQRVRAGTVDVTFRRKTGIQAFEDTWVWILDPYRLLFAAGVLQQSVAHGLGVATGLKEYYNPDEGYDLSRGY